MKLTGKCKKDFDKWLHDNDHESFNYAIENDDETGIPTYEGRYFHHRDIYDFPFSMQYGVMTDFFDSVGISIDILSGGNACFDFEISWELTFFNDFSFKTRQEARERAIEKGNEIYNSLEK